MTHLDSLAIIYCEIFGKCTAMQSEVDLDLDYLVY